MASSAVAQLSPPKGPIYKEECTECFARSEDAAGIEVCLQCFNGACPSHHAAHAKRTGHTLSLHLHKEKEQQEEAEEEGEDANRKPQKLTKLAIGVEGGAALEGKVKWTLHSEVRQWPEGQPLQREALDDAQREKLDGVVAAVLATDDQQQKDMAAAWQKRVHPCEHSLTLQQQQSELAQLPLSKTTSHCWDCDLQRNLWLCLTCGVLGCGRPLPPPMHEDGGNGHALKHNSENPTHPLVCKVGTITSDGKADCYCYACNDDVTDENLVEHLATFGIDTANAEKTEETMTELELKRNKLLELLSTEDLATLLPLYGPGLTGLRNLGNTCYMNSVLQVLVAVPEVQQHYLRLYENHREVCQREKGSCWHCQAAKLVFGMASGTYSKLPDNFQGDASDIEALKSVSRYEHGSIPPRMFKTLLTRGTMFEPLEQQDSYEFMQFFLRKLKENERKMGNRDVDVTQPFKFRLTQRVQCTKCKGVRYSEEPDTSEISLGIPVEKAVPPLQPVKDESKAERLTREYKSEVPWEECLRTFSDVEGVEDFLCPQCKEKTVATKQAMLSTFPRYLIFQMRRFQFDDWVPYKLSVRVTGLEEKNEQDEVGAIEVDFSKLEEGERPAGEKLLPKEEKKVEIDEAAVAQLEQMGFPKIRCQNAVLATGNSGAQAAMEYLFGHMDDPALDKPIEAGTSDKKKEGGFDAAAVSQLMEMGFTEKQVKHALTECDGSVERSLDWLFSHPEAGVGWEEPKEEAQEEGAPQDMEVEKDDSPKRYRLFAFILHKGNDIGGGHYVAYIWNEKLGHWVLYDDEKVSRSVKPPIDQAYLYFFKRI